MTTGRINQVAVRQRSRRPADCSAGPGSDSEGAHSKQVRRALRHQTTFPSVSNVRLGRETHSHGHWSQPRSNTETLYTALEQTTSIAVEFLGYTSLDCNAQTDSRLTQLLPPHRGKSWYGRVAQDLVKQFINTSNLIKQTADHPVKQGRLEQASREVLPPGQTQKHPLYDPLMPHVQNQRSRPGFNSHTRLLLFGYGRKSGVY